MFDSDEMFVPLEAMAMFTMMMNDPALHRYIFLTNEGEKVKWAIQFLLEHENIPDIHRETKNAQIAINFIERGNQNFGLTPWKSLLEIYTRGVIHAPSDSSQLALAYGNRSAALYNGGLYEDCILDVERALNIGYPDKLKAKLYSRKARCLYALNNDKMSPAVDKAVVECRKWFEKLDDANKKCFSVNLSKLLSSSSKQKPFEKVDQRLFLPQTPEGNAKILGASSAVEIKYSGKLGRHVVATRDIETGETLSMHENYASIIEPNFLLRYCWNCSRRVRAGVPCHECVTVIYCSESCRDIAWRNYHDIECQVIPTILHEKMSKLELMVLKLTAKAYKEAGSVQNLREKLGKIDRIKDPITKSYTANLFDDSKYASVYTSSKSTRFPVDTTIKCVFILYCLAATTKMFGQKISNLRNLLSNPSAIFMGTLIMKNYNICQINCLQTIGYKKYDKLCRIGCTINPFINLVNHSCDPTACVVTARDIRALVAIQRIKKGDHISITYDSCFWAQTIDERQNSMKQFDFKCDCKPCVENWGPLSTLFFPSDKHFLPMNVEALLRRLSQKDPESYMHEMAITDIPQLISTLSRIMNIYQHTTEYPTQEMILLKHGLYTLYNHASSMLSVN